MFHGTKLENVDNILKKGLRPRRPPSMGFDDEGNYSDAYPRGVYLTDDLEHASAFGDAVFEVDHSKLRGPWEYSADEMAEVYTKRIPPRLLKRIK